VNENYYYLLNGKRQGPASLAELKLLACRQELKRSDKLWVDGMEDWQLAGSLTDVFAGLPPEAGTEPSSDESSPIKFWYFDVLKKYAVFDGRSRREEYWVFVLVNIAILLLLSFFESVAGKAGLLVVLYELAVICPWAAVGIRRMHDTGRSGWWLLVPFANLVFLVQDSQPGGNQYGANPETGSTEQMAPIPPVTIPRPEQTQTVQPASISRDLESQLREIVALKDNGLITEVECEQKRRKILGL
jgi:uncharacterized membrane protein YhaH (DUF805 family)